MWRPTTRVQYAVIGPIDGERTVSDASVMTSRIETNQTAGRAVVVGGSLGGLHAAVVLLSEGWDVDVYERSPRLLDGAGAGIVAHRTLLRIINEYQGVALDQVSCPAMKVRTYAPARETVTTPKNAYRLTSWTTIYRELLKIVSTDRYHLGETLTSIEQTRDAAIVGFESGLRTEADLVVCADGISSTARDLLGITVKTAYSGYIGWRGVVDPDALDPEVAETLIDSISFGTTEGSHIVAYPIPFAGADGKRLLNFVWYRDVADGPELDSLMTDNAGQRRPFSLQDVQPGHIEVMRAAAKEFGNPLAQMVIRTPKPFLQVIVDQTPSQMAVGRVAVIGDAASVARPHAAAGTAKAAENGWQLAAHLQEFPGDVPLALSSWERTQLDLGESLVARARELGTTAQQSLQWGTDDPAAEFGLYGAGQ